MLEKKSGFVLDYVDILGNDSKFGWFSAKNLALKKGIVESVWLNVAIKFGFMPKNTKRAVMFTGFQKIVEERILKAQKNGEFDNLMGNGKPLDLRDDIHVSEDLRLAFKILKNADCLPPEVELKKEIKQTEALLEGMAETSEKYRIMKKLNYLIMKLNTTRDTSVTLEMPQLYANKLVNHLGSSKSKK